MANPVMSQVLIRTYRTDAAFADDADRLVGLGYRVAAQSQSRGGLSVAGMVWLLVAVVFAILGFANALLWIGAILFGLLAATGRRHELKVTYQRT